MRALRAGFQAHMAKPVEPSELLAIVASFVELTGAERRRAVTRALRSAVGAAFRRPA